MAPDHDNGFGYGYGPVQAPPQPVVVTIYTNYPPPDWTPTNSMHHRQPEQTSTTTVTYMGTSQTPQPENASASSTPYAFTPSPRPDGPPGSSGSQKIIITAAGAVVSVIGILVLIGLLVFICKRSRRKYIRNQSRRDTMDEQMIGTTSSESVLSTRAYMRPEPLALPSLGYHSTESSFTRNSPLSPSHPSLPSPVAPPPPVLLSSTVNHSYLTGIDTSDHISLSDQSSQTPPPAHADLDEPPPPYRPRSMPPISRHGSVHIANGMLPNYRPGQVVIPVTETSSSNPFEDPEEDVFPPPTWCSDSGDCAEVRESCASNANPFTSAAEEDPEDQDPTTTHSTI